MFDIFRIYGKEMNEVNQEIDLQNNQIVLIGNILIFLKLVNTEFIDMLFEHLKYILNIKIEQNN